MATERPLREVISDLLATVECDAVTMHVRDAWAPHLQYRLFCMQGVQDRARMFAGIRLDNPKSPSALLDWEAEQEDEFEYLCQDVRRSVFRNSKFAKREGIAAFARYHLWVGRRTQASGKPDVVVMFNYTSTGDMDDRRIGSMQTAVEAVRQWWAQRRFDQADVDDLLQQTEWMGRIMRETREAMVQDQVHAVIQSVFECVASMTGTVNGVHCGVELYRDDAANFETVSIWHRGKAVHPKPTNRRTWDGGVISAAREFSRPLFIESVEDLVANKSLMKRYGYVPPRSPRGRELAMTQEIAAPMYLDGEAIGVLNVEVKRHGRLKPHHVGLVEMLADVTAVAIGSSRQDAMRGTMLQLVEGVLSADDASPNVDIIRDGVQDVIDDVDCHFWYRRASGDRFEWISSRKSSLEPRTGANAGCPNGCGTRAWTGSGRTCAG